MSDRTFARRFVQETGTTPLRWLTGQRILLAQELLEETTETVDVIADRAGFGNAAALRHHFRAWRGTTPQAYRHAFSPGAMRDSPDGIPASPDASPSALGPSPAAYAPSRSLVGASRA
jgi:AraC-like DNA-binding protein